MYLVSLSFYTIPLFLIRRIFYLPVFLKGTVEYFVSVSEVTYSPTKRNKVTVYGLVLLVTF